MPSKLGGHTQPNQFISGDDPGYLPPANLNDNSPRWWLIVCMSNTGRYFGCCMLRVLKVDCRRLRNSWWRDDTVLANLLQFGSLVYVLVFFHTDE